MNTNGREEKRNPPQINTDQCRWIQINFSGVALGLNSPNLRTSAFICGLRFSSRSFVSIRGFLRLCVPVVDF
jgi:hypothetical protein